MSGRKSIRRVSFETNIRQIDNLTIFLAWPYPRDFFTCLAIQDFEGWAIFMS